MAFACFLLRQTFARIANFLAIVTLARFLLKCFIMFLCGIKFHGDHPILISLGRFLSVLILPVTEGICIFFLEFSFVLVIVDPNS